MSKHVAILGNALQPSKNLLGHFIGASVPQSARVPLEAVPAALLAYPQGGDLLTLQTRRQALQDLGISAVYRWGPKQVQGWPCVGLGYCGLVVLVTYTRETQAGNPASQLAEQPARQQSCAMANPAKGIAALKIRRSDAPQATLRQEAAMLRLANQHHIGPRLLASTDDFLLMDYVDGLPLIPWLRSFSTANLQTANSQIDGDPADREIAQDFLDFQTLIHQRLRQLLQQAFLLDQLGLDHGNLRCVTGHVLVTEEQAVLLDFSSASQTRRAANVTSLTQGLFWGTAIAPHLVPQWIAPNREQSILALRQYKHLPTQEHFETLLQQLFQPSV
jgi:putative serine/threonine protein kinase